MSGPLLPHLNVLHGEYLLLRDDHMAGKDTYQAMCAALAAYEAAMTAHVAAEVAAERARCVAIAEDAAMVAHGVLHRRDMDLAPESVVSYWSGTYHSALSMRNKLDAALPPSTPEGRT